MIKVREFDHSQGLEITSNHLLNELEYLLLHYTKKSFSHRMRSGFLVLIKMVIIIFLIKIIPQISILNNRRNLSWVHLSRLPSNKISVWNIDKTTAQLFWPVLINAKYYCRGRCPPLEVFFTNCYIMQICSSQYNNVVFNFMLWA